MVPQRPLRLPYFEEWRPLRDRELVLQSTMERSEEFRVLIVQDESRSRMGSMTAAEHLRFLATLGICHEGYYPHHL